MVKPDVIPLWIASSLYVKMPIARNSNPFFKQLLQVNSQVPFLLPFPDVKLPATTNVLVVSLFPVV